MKKILTGLIAVLALAIPSVSFAAFNIPWYSTSTNALNTTWISPVLLNGVYQIPVAQFWIATSTTVASSFPYASTTALTVSGSSYLGTVKSGTWNGTAISLANGGTGLTTASTDSVLTSTNGSTWSALSLTSCSAASSAVTYNTSTHAWGCNTIAGGGGAAAGTWSTTTSQVSGELVNFSNNNTDVVTVGANSTTSAKFFFDPNGGTDAFLTSFRANRATTTQATSTNLAISSVASALLLTNANGSVSAYGGAAGCTNQVVTAISALGTTTCHTIVAADVSLANLTATDGSLTFSGSYTGATARTIGVNDAFSHSWSVLQNFTYASTTMITATLMYKTGSFSIATTTAWAGTTTEQQLFTPIQAETWLGATCNTLGVGTVNVQFFNNSAKMNMIPASSTPAYYTLTTNNSISALATTTFVIGTPASSPTSVTCTIKRLAPAN